MADRSASTPPPRRRSKDNAVVLSGGYDVLGGDHWTTSGVSNVALTITNASLSSRVDAQVTGGAAINSSQGALSFGGDLSIIGGETTTVGGNVLIDGMNGNPLTIAGDLYVRAFRQNADGSQTGLITRLGAQTGSTVTIGGDVTLDSDSFGAAAEDFGLNGTNATGGNAQINIGANSTLNVTGSVNVHANGYGGHNNFGDGAGGAGIGGQALVMAINGNSTVTVGGSVFVSAYGEGGSAGECSICEVVGGNGTGGNASVHTNVGTGNLMQIAGDVSVSQPARAERVTRRRVTVLVGSPTLERPMARASRLAGIPKSMRLASAGSGLTIRAGLAAAGKPGSGPTPAARSS